MQSFNIQDCILYEDKDILVCHKPAGVAVQSARFGMADMESSLKNHLALKTPGKMPYLGIIHRLDQPVEGVLVFAKTPKAAAELNRQITSKTVTKEYLAVTAQLPEEKRGIWKITSKKITGQILPPWSLRRLPEQRKPAWITVFRKKSKTNAPQQEKESLLRSSWIQDDIIRSVCRWLTKACRSLETGNITPQISLAFR